MKLEVRDTDRSTAQTEGDNAAGVRVVWVVDHRVVYDVFGPMEGITRVPAGEMAHITWSESAAPTETAEGDGLMLVRDYAPGGVTIIFLKNGKLYSGVPANLPNIELR